MCNEKEIPTKHVGISFYYMAGTDPKSGWNAGDIDQVVDPLPRPVSPCANKGLGQFLEHDHEIHQVYREMQNESAYICSRDPDQPDGAKFHQESKACIATRPQCADKDRE